jgi:putative ABC transport system permease protein
MRDRSPLRFPLRLARHEPLYACATVLLLTLGIGALGALLALCRGTLAQPPPLANWERLVVLRGATAQANRLPLSYPDFEDLRRDVPALADIALTRTATVTLEAGRGAPQRVAAARVTPNLATVLGVALLHGPGFDVVLGQPADQVVVSERMWRGTLGAEPIERLALRIGGRAVAVVGVLPAGLRFPTPEIDLWLPLAPAGNEARRDYAFTTPWGLLAAGSTLDDARQQIAQRVARLAIAYPQSHTGLRIEPFPVERDLLAAHRPLLVVFGLVGLLVFVAVAGNVAALAAARELARRNATATRLVLGASHRRLFGETLRASASLALLASAGGSLLAWTIVRAAEAADAEVFTALRATVDATVLAGTAAGALSLLLVQLAPTGWMQRRIALAAPGSGSLRAMTANRGTVRAAGFIVGVQMAMCFATVGTLALAHFALAAMERADLGFETEARFSAALGVPELEHAATVAGFEAALDEVARLPGVEAAAAVSRLPLLRGASSVGLVPSSVGLSGEAALPVDARLVVGPADEALGLRLLRGRFLDRSDAQGSGHAVVVDRRFAEHWLAHRDPLGARIRLQIDPAIEWQVVGVMEPVRWRTFDDGEAPALLLAAAQFDNIAPMRNAQLVWRGRYDAAAGPEPLREALRRGMPLLSADTPRPLQAVVDEASGPTRMAARLLRLLTGIALLLALVGTGALLLYRHERQRRAIGIRLCLGASRARVVAAALADSAALALGGGAIGAAVLWAALNLPEAGRLLPASGLLAAMFGATGAVAFLAVLGGVVPAWQIVRLEPRQVLQDAG